MTLPLNDRVTSTYTADGTNKEFNFDFRVFFNVDTGSYGLEVRKVIPGGYEVLSSSLYTVVPNEDLTAGKIVFAAAPIAGTEIYLAGKTPISQQLNLTNYGRFSAEAIETNFDFITAIIQEFISSLDIEISNRILADQALKDYVVSKFTQLATDLNTRFENGWTEINNYISTVVPVFACIMKREIDNYIETDFIEYLDGYVDANINNILENSLGTIVNHIAMPFAEGKTYALNQRVELENGDIVRSTIANNLNNPNENMTGWVKTNDASQIFDESGANQQTLNAENKAVMLNVNTNLTPSTQTKDSFKNAYSTKNANLFEQLRALSACGRCYIWKNPLFTNGAITVNPFTTSDTNIIGTCTSGYTVKLTFSNGTVRTVKSTSQNWSIPNSPALSSSDLVSAISYDAPYRFSVGINMSGWKTAEWKFVADADNFIRMEYGYTGAIRSPTAFADATNKVGTVSGGASNNAYFATVDSSFDLVFTGTGLLINQYVDANGGIFDVYLDGVLLRKMSCNVNNPENAGAVALNIQKLVVSDLANTTHTVKFVFKGADPLYPPTTSARGWFKNFTGADTHTAAVITGFEMGLSASGAKLVANGIIDFAISARAFGTTMAYDWTPSHTGVVGAMIINSRKIYIDNTLVDDALTIFNTEKELKELTIIQKYTAYNSNDTEKAYPLYDGTLVTKFDRVNGLSYAHETETRNKLDTSEGFMQMLSGRRTSDLLKFETDNGQTVDLSGAAPATDKQTYVGVVKSARWMGNNTGLAISVDSPEAASSLGKSYADTNPTMFNERGDGFCKLYFKTMGRNSVIEAGTKFVTRHKVWLATF